MAAQNKNFIFAMATKCLHNKYLIISILATLLHAGLITAVTAVTPMMSFDPAKPRECTSTDIRNECDSFNRIHGCTIIKGYLIIVLLPKINLINNTRSCPYEKYKFPLLREITDFMIFFDVKGLTAIGHMFPNLTVIRGRRLFMNYALGFSGMPMLQVLEFKSLVAIQRGHVFVGSCPKLCQLEKINFDRLTLSPGENHIFPVSPDTCPKKSTCKGCNTEYCWSNTVCQKFENDNVINLLQGSHHCHEECLGGCYNNVDKKPNERCAVCKGLTDHGACVKECPPDKYEMEHFQRCYTVDECVHILGLHTHGNKCVYDCPSGYILDNDLYRCIKCAAGDMCDKMCHPQNSNEPMTIYNLADADQLNGCKILNGSLVIAIRNKIDEVNLSGILGSILEIRGHLKIYRSPHLTSLKFLGNLKKISGQPLENGLYALIVYDNQNLKELWNPKRFELERGSMYIHMNNKLCNRVLKQFREQVIHDTKMDSLQTSDLEVMCGPAKLTLQIQVISHHAMDLSWRKDQTSDEIEIIYRPIPHGHAFEEQSELDSNICTRINYDRQLVLKSELRDNGTHYSYMIKNLEQNTKYGCLVKTFGINDKNDARSELEFATTRMDVPTPPKITIPKKTDITLTVQLNEQNRTSEIIEYYVLYLYEYPDDLEVLDTRNYCDQPAMSYQDIANDGAGSPNGNFNEDYEDCCVRLEDEAEDRVFVRDMHKEFSCSLDRPENCLPDLKLAEEKPLKSLRLERNETTFTLHHLERFRLYVFQVKACNNVGCSGYSLHHERTNYSLSGDKVDDLRACRVPGTTEYHVYFSEPKHPNSYIVSYMMHYRVHENTVDEIFQQHVICVTRQKHENSNYRFSGLLNESYSGVAVRVHSLAGDVITNWVNVTICPDDDSADAGVPDSPHSAGLNLFLMFFLVGAGGTIIWIFYKRRCWRKIPEMRRYLPLQRNIRELVEHPELNDDDRQILVDGFESVRFRNNLDDDSIEIN